MLKLILTIIVGIVIAGVACAALRPIAEAMTPVCAEPGGSWDALCQMGTALLPLCDSAEAAAMYIINGILWLARLAGLVPA